MQVTCVHRQLEARVVGPGSLLGSLRGRRARAPQILMGASSSSSTGCAMKMSRACVQSPRISASVRLTCLPGRLPRTSRSLAITSSTSDAAAAAEDEEAIGGEAERGAVL